MDDWILLTDIKPRRWRYYRIVPPYDYLVIAVGCFAIALLAAVAAWGQPINEGTPQSMFTPSAEMREYMEKLSPTPESSPVQEVLPAPQANWLAVHYRCQKLEGQTFTFVPIECNPATDKGCEAITLSCSNCSCPTEEK